MTRTEKLMGTIMVGIAMMTIGCVSQPVEKGFWLTPMDTRHQNRSDLRLCKHNDAYRVCTQEEYDSQHH